MNQNLQQKKERDMKGIILAGGTGTRLKPLTEQNSKQLLPVYNCQMIFYPLNTLIKGGIRDIMIIVAPESAGNYLNLLGSMFDDYGINLSFKVQKEPKGLPQAFTIGSSFINERGNKKVAMILGDNIFEDDFTEEIKKFQGGAHLFAKKVEDPERFGVAVFGENGNVTEIVEKPKEHISDYALTGLYLYDNEVVEVAENLQPSERDEYEIVDLHNHYLKKNELTVTKFDGAWFDAGTWDSIQDAGDYARKHDFYGKFDPILKDALAKLNPAFKK